MVLELEADATQQFEAVVGKPAVALDSDPQIVTIPAGHDSLLSRVGIDADPRRAKKTPAAEAGAIVFEILLYDSVHGHTPPDPRVAWWE
jgi:hypothetical protein